MKETKEYNSIEGHTPTSTASKLKAENNKRVIGDAAAAAAVQSREVSNSFYKYANERTLRNTPFTTVIKTISHIRNSQQY